MVPKRALRVMEGEVNRIMQLTSNSVIPIMYQVPRKSYRDFHNDLYPETIGFKTDLTVAQWFNGINMPVPKMSLDPAKRELGEAPIIVSICLVAPFRHCAYTQSQSPSIMFLMHFPHHP